MAKKTPGSWKMYRDSNGEYHAYKQAQVWDYAKNKWVAVGEMTEVIASECEFKGTLKLEQFSHYKSAHFYFRDLRTNFRYMMQGTEMEDILLNHTMQQGVISGVWGWVKRGNSISIKLLRELTEEEEEELDHAS